MSDYLAELNVSQDRIIARFSGEISTPHYNDFRHDYNDICRELASPQPRQLILDLTNATFFGSLFVGIMLKLSMRVRASGGRMIICGLSPQLSQLMQKLLLLERHAGEGNRLQHATSVAEAEQLLTQSTPRATHAV